LSTFRLEIRQFENQGFEKEKLRKALSDKDLRKGDKIPETGKMSLSPTPYPRIKFFTNRRLT